MKTVNNYHVAIIGGGPAGIAAAIQLKRTGIDPILIEKEKCGGLLRNAFLIENYTGFYKGISGEKLTSLFTKHLEQQNIIPVYNEVVNISFSESDKLFIIQTKINIYKSKVLIIASGLKHKKPEIINKLSIETERNIFYNIYDLNNPIGKKVLIIGAGDTAFDYALNLSTNNKVTIINRSKKIRALKLLQDRVKKNELIEYLNNTIIKDIIPEKKKQRVILNINNEHIEKEFDIILFAIGRILDLSFISSQIMKKRLELETDKVLYFIGDIINGDLRQASIAIGDGIKAAMEISKNTECRG